MNNPFFLIGTTAVLAFAAVAGENSSNPKMSDQQRSSSAGVFRFGAVGDGKVDDTNAIQAAVDSGIGSIRFPKGTFLISRPIVVDLDKVGYTAFISDGVATLVMSGPGPAVRFVGTHLKSADPEGYLPNVWDRQRMPIVDGIAIVGRHAEAVGIEASGTMQLTVKRVHLRQLLHGIHLLDNNRNVIIADSHIYENNGIGIYYDDVNLHQSNITSCHISYNDGGGIVSRKGNVRNIHITGCDIESNMSPESPSTANVLIDCRGSRYGTGEVAVTGCTIQHNNPSPGSANIRILGGSDPSGDLTQVREGNVTITGNVLSDVKANVHLRDCRGVVLTGNTLWQGYEHNLLVENCSSLVVGANNFDRNPRYNYGNTQAANNAIVLRDCEDCTLTGLHITNVWRSAAGLVIRNSRRIHATDCSILDCDNLGLLLENVEDSRISDFLVRDDRPGASSGSIRTAGGKGTYISDCFLHSPPDFGEGVSVRDIVGH